MDSESVLWLKARLLTEGAVLPSEEYAGRSGGAGPVRARYFILPTGTVCGIPIRRGAEAKKYGSAPLEPTEDPTVWVYDDTVELQMVPQPRFYDKETDDGISYKKIALLHGKGTLATTLYQTCRYWECGTQCRFCTIPLSYRNGRTLLEKKPSKLAEVVAVAEEEGVAEDVLLTTGTPPSDDMGALRMENTIQAIREISDIPIGVQFEPPQEKSYIARVSEAGADAIGMHIEIADEELRQRICPGKAEHGSVKLYIDSWEYALKYFEQGHVSTFILHGFGENHETTLQFMEKIAAKGVLPVVAPVRPASRSELTDYTPSYVSHLDETIEFYKSVGNILLKHNLNPNDTVAGCHKCGACTPIQEAYNWAESCS
ncbi:MAG: radical SAM protein [Candidatus Lokiarchaeota archaeon]|nr:radical SAM protein [Candidatus Lokiarchaeota archaeon]